MDRTYRTIEFKSRRGEIRGGFFLLDCAGGDSSIFWPLERSGRLGIVLSGVLIYHLAP